MSDPVILTTAEILLYRTLGGVGGTAIGLLIVQPRTWRGLAQRATMSMLSALMLSPALRWYLDWPENRNLIISAACLVAAPSYWAWHAVISLLREDGLIGLMRGKSRSK